MLKLTPDMRLNLLVAYPYMSESMIAAIRRLREVAPVRFMLDSGAYTAWNSGKTIDMEAYCGFLEHAPVPVDYAVQLDVFGNPEATYQNLLTMRERGFEHVLPVFTRGDTVERLNEFYSFSDYIMFGGVTTGEKNRQYINWFLTANGGRRAHWLGFVDVEFIRHYRPESADSSAWHYQARVGNINVYAGFGRWKPYHRTEMNKLAAEGPLVLAQNFITSEELAALRDPTHWRSGPGAMSLNLCARAHIMRSLDTERMIGTKIYMAASTPFQVDALRYAWNSIAAQR